MVASKGTLSFGKAILSTIELHIPIMNIGMGYGNLENGKKCPIKNTSLYIIIIFVHGAQFKIF
jgi:hypothetical protein